MTQMGKLGKFKEADCCRAGGVRITFNDVLDRVRAEASLSIGVQRNLGGDITRLAKALSVQGIAATVDQSMIAAFFAKQTAAKMGFASAGGYAAFKSNVRRALRLSGVRVTDGRARNKLTPAWQALFDQISDKWTRTELSAFVSFVSDHGREPAAVTNADFEDYCRSRAVSVLHSKALKLTTKAVKAWRKAQTLVPDWPHADIAPKIKADRTYGLRWDAFPLNLQGDVEGFIGANADNPLGWLESIGGRGPRTAANYRDCIRRMASILVLSGKPAEQIASLGDLVTLENADTVLRFMYERTDRKKGGHLGLMAFLLYYVARDWLKLDAAVVEQFRQIHVATKQKTGMAEKTRRRLRQFDDDSTMDRILWLPDTLLELAKAMPIDIHSAKLARAAAYLALAFDTASRSFNVAALDLDANFFQQGDRLWIGVLGAEVKNGEDLRAELRPETIAILRRYIDQFRVVHLGAPSSFLFPRKNGTAWTVSQAYEDVMDLAARYAGCDLNPHLIRSIVTKLILDDSPNALPVAQHTLGHRTMRTTAASYLDMTKANARKEYHRVLESVRQRYC